MSQGQEYAELLRAAADLQSRADAKLAEAVRLRAVLDAQPGPMSWLRGVRAVNERYEGVQRDAKVRVRAFDHGQHLSPLGGVSPSQPDALARGVVCQVVYETSVFDDRHLLAAMRQSVLDGEQARAIATLPFRCLIQDDQKGLIVFVRDGHAEALVLRPSAMLNALVDTFEMVWAQAIPIHPSTAPGLGGEPTEATQQLLGLMVAGLTDEGIARALGVSTRTVARRILRLQEILGAQGRFQLGAQAVRRGWLS